MLDRGPRINALLTAVIAGSVSCSVQAQTAGPALLRQLYGDVALEVRKAQGTTMEVGIADSARTVTVVLMASDVVQWADSAKRLLAAHLRGKQQTARWQAVVEEPGVSSGSIVIARSIEVSDTVIAVQVSSNDFEIVHATLDAEDAAAFVGAMKRIARDILKPPRPKSRRRPIS